jgi:3',5'-cyclic AMP phosphodiesterase CpdA
MRKLLLVILFLACVSAHADFTFVQISDTHVGVKQAAYNARYQEVIRQVNSLRPAFVIHTGDALTAWSAEDAVLFKVISKSLTAPMYVSPGNHDILNAKTAGASKVAEEISAWKQAIGPDRVSFEHEGCVFIGLDSNLWNTGYPAEKEQLGWLKSELRKAKGKRIFIFQHSPLFLKSPDEPNGDYFAVDNPARGELLRLMKEYHVQAVLTGHYHRFNDSMLDGIAFLTTPATSFSCAADKGLTGYSVFYVYSGGFTHRFVDLRTSGTPPSFEKQ